MPSEDELIEVRCPECGAVIKLTEREAEEKNSATCPKGHEVPLAKAL
ncbi:MAG: hypothetical protein JST00_14010 [Deltaproteobacteria bacterium]|nr:hypothetical protein [Deltaproteobacteria bacterium]